MEWLLDESSSEQLQAAANPWNILVVDDEPDVHEITRLALNRFTFEDRPLHFASAYSRDEAIQYIQNSQDKIAIILLDVVMESDEAGLELAQHVREQLANRYTRIILRTGQPGTAPKKEILRSYDIDAYKSKSELTKQDLESSFYTALRAYRDITRLKLQRTCIERIVNAITTINNVENLKQFSHVVLQEIEKMPDNRSSLPMLDASDAVLLTYYDRELHGLHMNAQQTEALAVTAFEQLEDEAATLCKQALDSKEDVCAPGYFCHFIKTHSGHEIVMLLKSRTRLDDEAQELLRLFASNVMLTYENLTLNEEISSTQHVLMGILGSAMESRSKETGAHVRRVGEYSALLAELAGMDGLFVERIRNAAPLHDVGKVSTPDAILNKPGKLTPEEWQIMQQHAEAGYQILEGTNNKLVQMASRIARDHHEKWNGQGYPRRVSGEEISLEGRITALADVFDALISKRCYKEAWTVDDAFNEIEQQKGLQFDPTLAELMLTNKARFVEIYDKFPD